MSSSQHDHTPDPPDVIPFRGADPTPDAPKVVMWLRLLRALDEADLAGERRAIEALDQLGFRVDVAPELRIGGQHG